MSGKRDQCNSQVNGTKFGCMRYGMNVEMKDKGAITLWKSLVLPVVEYCSVLWSPLKKSHIQEIEAIQWSYIRKILGTRSDYLDESSFSLYSLERRREGSGYLYLEDP